MKKSNIHTLEIPKPHKARINDLNSGDLELKHLMNVASVGFCYLDRNLRYIHINNWLANINGLPAEEHLGRSIRELFPQLAASIEPQFQQVINTGKSVIKGRAYAGTRSQNGRKRIFEHSYFADKQPDGTVIGICCFVEDVTEQVQYLEKLTESEKMFRTLANSVNAVPWQFDLKKGRFTFIGEQVVKLLGYPVSYWVDYDSWSNCVHADDRDAALKYCIDSTTKGLDHDFEYRCVNAEGKIVWIRDIVALKKDDTGEAIELFGFMIDISERKQLEKQVSQHQKHLENLVSDRTTKLNNSKQRLRELTNHMTRIAERERKSIARDLHDDLGQVLTSLKIDLAIIGRQFCTSEYAHIQESISEEFAAMSETLDKASEMLHGSVSKLRPDILDSLGLITALEWQTEEFFKSSQIECEFICELDSLAVQDDMAIAVYRIVQECLTNISRHAKALNSKVSVALIDNTLIVEVSDDGVGVSKQTLTSTKRFGLLGIRERASALSGSVQIESTLGEGTIVRITIPINP